jgi:hypothetical protein
MGCVWLLAMVVAILLLIFWLRQFILLMATPDASFPGRYDKILWFVLFLLGGIVGPIAYWYYGIVARRTATRIAMALDQADELEHDAAAGEHDERLQP